MRRKTQTQNNENIKLISFVNKWRHDVVEATMDTANKIGRF